MGCKPTTVRKVTKLSKHQLITPSLASRECGFSVASDLAKIDLHLWKRPEAARGSHSRDASANLLVLKPMDAFRVAVVQTHGCRVHTRIAKATRAARFPKQLLSLYFIPSTLYLNRHVHMALGVVAGTYQRARFYVFQPAGQAFFAVVGKQIGMNIFGYAQVHFGGLQVLAEG